jgi:post-segregation antitoxin (ccd killing protein)
MASRDPKKTKSFGADAKPPDDRQARWVATNQQALNGYAKHVATAGVFSDGLRRF